MGCWQRCGTHCTGMDPDTHQQGTCSGTCLSLWRIQPTNPTTHQQPASHYSTGRTAGSILQRPGTSLTAPARQLLYSRFSSATASSALRRSSASAAAAAAAAASAASRASCSFFALQAASCCLERKLEEHAQLHPSSYALTACINTDQACWLCVPRGTPPLALTARSGAVSTHRSRVMGPCTGST